MIDSVTITLVFSLLSCKAEISLRSEEGGIQEIALYQQLMVLRKVVLTPSPDLGAQGKPLNLVSGIRAVEWLGPFPIHLPIIFTQKISKSTLCKDDIHFGKLV